MCYMCGSSVYYCCSYCFPDVRTKHTTYVTTSAVSFAVGVCRLILPLLQYPLVGTPTTLPVVNSRALLVTSYTQVSFIVCQPPPKSIAPEYYTSFDLVADLLLVTNQDCPT